MKSINPALPLSRWGGLIDGSIQIGGGSRSGTFKISLRNAAKTRQVTIHAWDNESKSLTMVRFNETDLNDGNRQDAILSGVADPLADDQACNYRILKSYVNTQISGAINASY